MTRNRNLAALALAVALLGGSVLHGEEFKFDVQPGELLRIDLDTGGDVDIRGAAGSVVRISSKAHGRDADSVRVTARRTGKTVKLESRQAERRRNFSGGVDFTIEVPQRFDVDLSSMGGSVAIRDVEGEFSGSTMGGGIELHDLRGRIDLSTMGGGIEVYDTVASGKVSTMGGNVRLKNVSGGLHGSTMGGQVRIEGGDVPVASSEGPSSLPTAQSGDVVRITSMGGAIHVASAPNGADVETMGGDVRVDSARGFVKAKTMGGDVTVRDAAGDVRASSMGGDVTVEVVGGGGDVDLESMSGTIELTLPADFAGSFDVELEYTKSSRRDYEIRSDFPLAKHEDEEWRYGHGSPRKSIYGEGKSGDGHNKVTIHTVNGDVVIHKGR